MALRRFPILSAFAVCLIGSAWPADAVPIVNDPNGFEGIPWGATFSEGEHFGKVEEAGRLQTYEVRGTVPKLGPVDVDSMRFTTFEGKFGRVTVRYTGKERHEKILAYLQATYGPLDRTPGQIAVGPIRVYAWQGFDTEVTLRYEARDERGIIFFESRSLREKLAEGHSATVY
jgi:opacity protein-like surface antigen